MAQRLLVACSIPLTVAMTLGMCHMMGVDLQQVSIAALIIALGLLVDDPVVAGDAINRELAHGQPRDVAAWLGPQKLARAILFATLTNCVAFLPLLLVTGKTGEFIWSLPVVVTASLVASRIVSMTFMPLLGYYVLRGQKGLEAGLTEGGRGATFARYYNGFSEWCLDHKTISLGICLLILGVCRRVPAAGRHGVLPARSPFGFHGQRVSSRGCTDPPDSRGSPADHRPDRRFGGTAHPRVHDVCGCGWAAVLAVDRPRTAGRQLCPDPGAYDGRRDHFRSRAPTEKQPPRGVPGPRDDRTTGNRPSRGRPRADSTVWRRAPRNCAVAAQTKDLLRAIPGSDNIHDDWDPEVLQISLNIDPDRANLTGITNQDVAAIVHTGFSGYSPTQLRERDRLIPITLRLRCDERTRYEDLTNLVAVSSVTNDRVPLNQIAQFKTELVAPKICRRDHERCLTVKCDTVPGVLPSQVVRQIDDQLKQAQRGWPHGYRYEFGGEKYEQQKGFASLSRALIMSLVAIYLVLVWQFNSVTKPLVVFAAVPFGLAAGMMGLLIFHAPFGFMAFLGVASLAGVIVSHIIVLFDYIEDAQEHGQPLRRAVIDSALVRLRPVLVTVLATVGGLIPLALEGGPLVGTDVLRANRRFAGRHTGDQSRRAGAVRDVRGGPQDHPLGLARSAADKRVSPNRCPSRPCRNRDFHSAAATPPVAIKAYDLAIFPRRSRVRR